MKEEEKKYIKTRNQKATEQLLKLKELQLENNKQQKNLLYIQRKECHKMNIKKEEGKKE